MRWIVDEVKVTTAGPDSQCGFGFKVVDAEGAGRSLLQLNYDTKEEAERARGLVSLAIASATYIEGRWGEVKA